MSNKTIPLGAVRVALTGALIKRQATEVHARTVAMTSYTPLARCCGSRRLYVDAKTVHFGVMESGELSSLIKRVQREQGMAEVRKTWGQSVRALLAEVGTGVMR